MTCPNCVKHVTKSLSGMEGVSDVNVSLEAGTAMFKTSRDIPHTELAAVLRRRGLRIGLTRLKKGTAACGTSLAAVFIICACKKRDFNFRLTRFSYNRRVSLESITVLERRHTMNHIASVDGKLFCLNYDDYRTFTEEFGAGTLRLEKYADKQIARIDATHFVQNPAKRMYQLHVNGMLMEIPEQCFSDFATGGCKSMPAVPPAPKPIIDVAECGFSPDYELLGDMYDDEYFPDFLVDKVKAQLLKLDDFLSGGVTEIDAVQAKLDEIVNAINDLEDVFAENDSEIETAARESIAEGVGYILWTHGIDIDIEEAIRERDW